jgi:glycosyltransferase involved in cell wall biosynthesis
VRSLTVCAKSRWHPAIRREHALALEASRRGFDVTFVEAPDDIRSVPGRGPIRFVRSLAGSPEGPAHHRPSVVARTVPVPGHRGPSAESVDARLLRLVLARHTDPTGPVVCNLPWHWPAVSGLPRRTVFDCADDWTRLYPASRTRRFTELFSRIADEADEVLVVSPALARLFPGREVIVVPNGADADAVAAGGGVDRPGRRALAYVGTLSERFDVDVVGTIMEDLPGWTLDLYGPCHYAGTGDRPAPELAALLASLGNRLRWHGAIPRSAVAAAIDGADVAIVPNRPDLSDGQSSMKLFDVAARGRPAVVSAGVTCAGPERPPGTYVAEAPGEWAPAILAAADESGRLATERINWARSNTWEQRWPAWSSAVFGSTVDLSAVA